ncbi:MAG: RNA polymerase factor sigma-54, partial [Casimicrobiaceae bacterium]
MKQTLQLKLSQHLTLTPQLQQSIRLLQLSTIELNAEVERMLQENPLLEKVDTDDEPATPAYEANSTASAPESAPNDRATHDEHTNASPSSGPDESDFTDYGGSGDGDWGSAPSSDDDEFYPQQVAANTLRDHLIQQLAL